MVIRSDSTRELIEYLIERVRVQRRFLGLPYYTWWFEYDALELFQPFSATIPRKLWTRWSRFVETASTGMLQALQGQEDGVEELASACRSLQKKLEESAELEQVFRQYTSPDILAELGATLDQLFGARSPEHYLSYLAQLIVNVTPPDCSPLYTIRPLWLRYGDRFLRLRESSVFAAEIHQQETAGKNLLLALEQAETLLSALSVEHEPS